MGARPNAGKGPVRGVLTAIGKGLQRVGSRLQYMGGDQAPRRSIDPHRQEFE